MADNVTKCLRAAGKHAQAIIDAAGGEVTSENFAAAVSSAKADATANSNRGKRNIQHMAELIPKLKDAADRMGHKAAVQALISTDPRDRSRWVSIDGMVKGIEAMHNTELSTLANLLRPTTTGGVRNADLMAGAVRVVTGGVANSNEEALFAAAIAKVLDDAHRFYTDAGGVLGKLDNFFPTRHDSSRLLKAGVEKWKIDVKPRLDRSRMVDKDGNVLDDAQLDALLNKVYESITTKGANKMDSPHVVRTGGSGGMFARRHINSRVLHFANGDDWVWYSNHYGQGDLWGQLTNYLHNMAIDTAAMKVLGVNADKNYQSIVSWARKHDSGIEVANLNHMWKNLAGFDHSGDNWLARFGQANRDFASSLYMGRVLAASMPDSINTALNAMMNDMSVVKVLKHLGGAFKQEDREFLGRIAGEIDYSLSVLAQNLRFEENVGKGIARRLSNINYRVNFGTAWTDAWRHAHIRESAGRLGRLADTPEADLSESMRAWLRTYGLTGQWDEIRKAPTEYFKGEKYLVITSLDDEDLKARTLGAIFSERDLGVLTPDTRVRAIMNQGLDPGTVGGEVVRSFAHLRYFFVAMLINGTQRYMFSERFSRLQRAGYLGGSVIGMTFMGAVAEQLIEMSKGREPMSMDDPTFVARAALRGGSVPIISDLLLQMDDYRGRTTAEVLLGPSSAPYLAAGGLVKGLAGVLMEHEGAEEVAGKSLEKLLAAPVVNTSIWSSLAVQRLLTDEVQGVIDPTFEAREYRRERNVENRTGQDYWWGFDAPPWD
jgi:hypothetical protein